MPHYYVEPYTHVKSPSMLYSNIWSSFSRYYFVVGTVLMIAGCCHTKGESGGNEEPLRFIGSYHESILKSAIATTDKILRRNFYRRGTDSIIRGNLATDNPDSKMKQYYDWSGSSLDWQEDHRLQRLHFLRSNPACKLQSARAACEGARDLIKEVTLTALQRKDTDDFFYFLGHATHIIQDSFSTGHAKRSTSHLRRIDDVCEFSIIAPKTGLACHHDIISSGDMPIWTAETLASATNATIGFLVAVSIHLDNHPNSVPSAANFLEPYFVVAQNKYTGYFVCDNLDTTTAALEYCPSRGNCVPPGGCHHGQSDCSPGELYCHITDKCYNKVTGYCGQCNIDSHCGPKRKCENHICVVDCANNPDCR